MKFAVPSITAAAETSAFSMGEYVNNDVMSATSDDIGKLKNEISTLQYKIRRMTSADTRSKPNSKPWKPEVTPPRKKGSNFRGNGGRQNDSSRQASNNTGTNNSGNGRSFNGRGQSRNSGSKGKSFGNRSQNNSNFGGNQRNRSRGRRRFDTSPNVRRPRVASKTIKIKVCASTVMSLDTSLGNPSKRLKMKSPGDSVEWTQTMNRMASIQIMMIVAFILMTMMITYLPL